MRLFPACFSRGWRVALGSSIALLGLRHPAAAAEPTLPSPLSPWAMFLQADVVVRSVMVGLAVAAFVTWTVWLAKTVELIGARRRLAGALRDLTEADRLDNVAITTAPVAPFLDAARRQMSVAGRGHRPEGIKERVALHLERLEGAAGRRIAIGTGVLATIGATAPFVGLFGTVWGIMNSFVGIAKSQTTNLAVVAPGIAEALLATALGLVAAIPAVVIYNLFARQIATYRALLGDAASAIRRLVSSDLDDLRGNEDRHGLRSVLAAGE